MANKCTSGAANVADQMYVSSSHVMDVVCSIGSVRSELCVGLDEDLTNAVTKRACVSLWWHWSTVLVNANVFRIWLMCFLLTPVTHMCGGCCALVIKSDKMLSLLQNAPKNTAFLFKCQMKNDKKMWKKRARLCFLIVGFVFVGAFLHTDACMMHILGLALIPETEK